MRLNRRAFVKAAASVSTLVGGFPSHLVAQSSVNKPPVVSRELRALFETSISIDALLYTQDNAPTLSAETLEAMRVSGQTAAFWDVAISRRGRSLNEGLRLFARWNEELDKHQDVVVRVLSAKDIEDAKRAGKFAMVYLSQDASILNGELAMLRMFFDLGLRVLQLTHDTRNQVGNGYRDRNDGTLSHFGVDVVERCNELGILIDLSHCGDKTTLDAIAISRQPCVFTHVGCRALYRSLRNRTDQQIRALADKGGVVGIFNISEWLTTEDTVNLNAALDHIHHVVQIAGIDHVGFGSDHSMEVETVDNVAARLHLSQVTASQEIANGLSEVFPKHVLIQELNTPFRMLVLADGLEKRGYTASQIEKILGGNFLRVFRQVVGS
jgi:membrane dipeptidase